MEKQVKLHIDTELWHRAKVAAAKANISLKLLCTRAIEAAVEALEENLKQP